MNGGLHGEETVEGVHGELVCMEVRWAESRVGHVKHAAPVGWLGKLATPQCSTQQWDGVSVHVHGGVNRRG